MSDFVIDCHAALGEEYHLQLDTGELLRRMDAHAIDIALAHPMGAELAVENTTGNTRVLCSHARVKALVSVNPWFGAHALTELQRCRDAGAVGLFLHPSRQGFFPTDDIVLPLLNFARQAQWPVMFHTGTYIHSDVLALGEVAREHPDIAFIAGGGGFTDMWFELPGVFNEVENLYLDTSLIWGDAIEQIVRECGAHRVLFGGGEPRNRYASSLQTIRRLGLTAERNDQIFSGNSRRLFDL